MTDAEILTRAAQIVRTRLAGHNRFGRFVIRVIAGSLERFAQLVEAG
jgi:hypothetical protein